MPRRLTMPSGGALYSVNATASIVLSATAVQNVAWPVASTASIVLSAASVLDSIEWAVAGTASIVLSAAASKTSILLVSASAEIILSSTADAVFEAPTNATATIILSASASETATFDNFLLQTPLAVLILSSSAVGIPSYSAVATATIVLTAGADADGGLITADRTAGAILLLRCRADVPGIGVNHFQDYLGRFQQGQELPLAIQCFATGETPGLPVAAPIVRMYREGTLVDEVILPIQEDAQVVGRFGMDYRLGYLATPGRYLAAYWYEANAMVVSQYQVFEVVPGGDPAGPVIASQVIGRPDGDRVLAQPSSGTLLFGRDPYLDEGV